MVGLLELYAAAAVLLGAAFAAWRGRTRRARGGWENARTSGVLGALGAALVIVAVWWYEPHGPHAWFVERVTREPSTTTAGVQDEREARTRVAGPFDSKGACEASRDRTDEDLRCVFDDLPATP